MTTRTPQDYALKDCPFCGGSASAEQIEDAPGWVHLTVLHKECFHRPRVEVLLLNRDDLERWNRRAPQSGWISVDVRLPEPGMPVLLDIGRKFPLRAMWAAKHTVEASDECPDDWAEYDEETDMYYCPEGWYEWNECEETHWRVSSTPSAWMEIPLPPSTKGDPT